MQQENLFKIPKRYKEVLDKACVDFENEYVNDIGVTYVPRGWLCHFNEQFKGKILENVHTLTFVSLFNTLLISLYDEKYINPESVDVERIRYFWLNKNDLRNNNQPKYYVEKMYCNSLYGMMGNKFKKEDEYERYKSLYLIFVLYNCVVDEIVLLNPNKIIYTDSDIIYSTDVLITHDDYNEYEKETLKYFIIEDKKMFLTFDGYDFKGQLYRVSINGHRDIDTIEKAQQYVSDIRIKERNDKINLILED